MKIPLEPLRSCTAKRTQESHRVAVAVIKVRDVAKSCVGVIKAEESAEASGKLEACRTVQDEKAKKEIITGFSQWRLMLRT